MSTSPLLTAAFLGGVAAVAVPLAGDDEVNVVVEITPLVTTCVSGCPVDEPPPLAATGAEPISLLLPIALCVSGLIALAWAHRDRYRRGSAAPGF